MSRKITLIGFAVGLLATSSAGAIVDFQVIGTSSSFGSPLDSLLIGEEVTINVRMSNPTGTVIRGVGAAVQGYDTNVVQFVSGQAAGGPFFCNTAACTSGLPNGIEETLAEASYPNVAPYVQLISATTGGQPGGDGTRDPGLDGVVNGGDAEFRVVFRLLAVGSTTLNIGTSVDPLLGNVIVLNGGDSVQGNNASVVLSAIPEPGSALLLGLGLAGLSGSRMRRSASISTPFSS